MWQEIEKIFENLIANIDVLLFGLLKILLIFVVGHLLKRILCAAIKKSLNRRAAKNPHSLSAKKYGTVITLTQSVMRYLIDFIMLVMLLDVLGLWKEEDKIPEEILALAEKRAEARAQKNWALADEIRDTLKQKGYEIKDGADGMKINKI